MKRNLQRGRKGILFLCALLGIACVGVFWPKKKVRYVRYVSRQFTNGKRVTFLCPDYFDTQNQGGLTLWGTDSIEFRKVFLTKSGNAQFSFGVWLHQYLHIDVDLRPQTELRLTVTQYHQPKSIKNQSSILRVDRTHYATWATVYDRNDNTVYTIQCSDNKPHPNLVSSLQVLQPGAPVPNP